MEERFTQHILGTVNSLMSGVQRQIYKMNKSQWFIKVERGSGWCISGSLDIKLYIYQKISDKKCLIKKYVYLHKMV